MNITKHNTRKKQAAKAIADSIHIAISSAPGGTTAPALMADLGIAHYTMYRSLRLLVEDGRVRETLDTRGIGGRKIRTFFSTGRTAIDPRHTGVLSKARTLPQPFASLVAQFI